MAEALLRLAAFASCTCGMAWLALAMPPHWQQVRRSARRPAHTPRTLRIFGSSALALSLALALRADHGSIAPLVWVMMLTAAALVIALTLAYRPGWLSWLVAFVGAPPPPPA